MVLDQEEQTAARRRVDAKMHDLNFRSNAALAQTKDEKVRKVIMRARYMKSVSPSSSSSTTGLGASLDTGLKMRGGLR